MYLIHFSEKYHHARHYIGSTFDLELRTRQHEAGQGARLLEVVTKADISWRVVRTWDGDRKLERKLKNWHKAALLCPHPQCSGKAAHRRANFTQEQTQQEKKRRGSVHSR